MDSHSLLLGIFPTQGSIPGLLHYGQNLYHLSHIIPEVPVKSPQDREGCLERGAPWPRFPHVGGEFWGQGSDGPMWTTPPPSLPLGLGANDELSGLRELQKWRWSLGTGWKANSILGESGSQTHFL